MGITVQFESYEEMIAFAGKLVGQPSAPAKKVTKPVKEESPVKEEAPAEETYVPGDSLPEVIEEENTPSFTLEEVRAKLTALTRAGKQKEVKAILDFVKAKNLTSVEPKDYAVVMEKAGAL